VHSVDQRPNLRHLCEPLGGTEGLIKTVGNFWREIKRGWKWHRQWIHQGSRYYYSGFYSQRYVEKE